MDADAAARTIQLVLAPVVMARERLELVTAVPAVGDERFATERLGEIDAQFPDLLRRHTLLHYAVVAGYGAILVFIASMFVLAAVVSTGRGGAAVVALWVFLAGTAVLLLTGLLGTLEALVSHRAVQYEVGRVRGLERADG
jgi:hypothetical protein